jgi:3-deoxy-7-phosphoheptulonate synthase
MIIVMGAGAAQKEIRTVIARIKALGYTPHPIVGKERTVIGAIGDDAARLSQGLESLPWERSS